LRLREHPSLLGRDLAIFLIMAILAGCGLVYEYLVSHYAGRVLGAMETAIYGIIGTMIVSMGIGSFLARRIRDAHSGFAWLEVLIALLGVSSVLIISATFAIANLLPHVIGQVFDLPPDLLPRGGGIEWARQIAKVSPYVIGAILGILIGMEIPLIARVREALYGEHLEHNTGSIYGIDYIGAGVGAALWVLFMLSMDLTLSAALTASANLAVGVLFFVLFRDKIRWPRLLLAAHLLTFLLVLLIAEQGQEWETAMEDLLYQDHVVFRMNTTFQHLTITRRINDPRKAPVYTFFLNGRTQFASNDERIYHAMLVYPALAASARHDRVLVIGGGDGLALRDILKWEPKQVVLVDLDRELVDFFTHPYSVDGEVVNQALLELNEFSFSDPRVQVHIGDAFTQVDALIEAGALFDTIIVDLPDPSHPDLNKLYSTRFYAKLRNLLAGDGAMTVQSTSPYHAKHAFLSIGKTVAYADFAHVEQYHHNVPSFGEWGWTIAVRNGAPARTRLARLDEPLAVDDGWTTRGVMLAAFEFSRHFFDDVPAIKVNHLGSMVAYQYHQNDWRREQGIFTPFEDTQATPTKETQ